MQSIFADASKYSVQMVEGTLAQLVEHRTENPGVPGSIPGGTTMKGLSVGLGVSVINPLEIRS